MESEYDVALSFAGSEREYVRKVADALNRVGIRVFFDEFAQVELWGKDLYEHLAYIYTRAARFCVVFVSRAYAERVWTSHERKSAQARAVVEAGEYLLPARFDDTELPGLLPTIGYINLRDLPPEDLADLIREKVGTPERRNYLPPNPERLYNHLAVESPEERSDAYRRAHDILRALTRMTEDERRILLAVFLSGCPADLPDNMHIDADLLRRILGYPPAEIMEILHGLRSLGIYSSLAEDHDEGDSLPTVVVEVADRRVNAEPGTELTHTLVLAAMMELTTDHYCEEHGRPFIERLDFSALSIAHFTPEANR